MGRNDQVLKKISSVGHLILNGLVWKSNRQKESKRPWDVEPNYHNMYYKCTSLVNKKIVLSCFILHILLLQMCV